MRRNLIEINESVLSSVISKVLPILIDLFGQPLKIFRRKAAGAGQEDDVYGVMSGVRKMTSADYDIFDGTILISAINYNQRGVFEAYGIFDDPGYVYAKGNLRDGDIIQVTRKDKRVLTFVVTDLEAIGLTIDIIYKFRVAILEVK